MEIKKNGKIYTAKENKASWTVSTSAGRVTASYNVPKADCPTFAALKKYIAESNLF